MFKPVLSLDVSKNSSFAATFLSPNKPFARPFSVKHSPEGLAILLKSLSALQDASGLKPQAILEATGNYSKAISACLQDAGYQVILLNPIESHAHKRSSIRKVKTDSVDAVRIAELFYMKKFTPQHAINPIIADLRSLCRHYDGVNELFVASLLKLHKILDLVFPYFHTVFSDISSNAALNLLSAFPTPELVLAANKDDILAFLRSSAFQKKSWPDEKYEKLVAAAKACLPFKEAQQSNVRVLREYITILLTHKKVLTDIRTHLITTAKLVPAFHLLISIPGVGELTAAAIVSEIADINRFPEYHQLIAFAGIDASVFQSGSFRASRNKISKRGSAYLRRALFLAASIGVRVNKKGPINPVLFEFYQLKLAEGKPRKVALIAACNKLLRIIHGIWRKNELFRA